MHWKTLLRRLLLLQIGLFAGTVIFIAVGSPELVASLKLYELFGAIIASILTVFGLLEMKSLTEE